MKTYFCLGTGVQPADGAVKWPLESSRCFLERVKDAKPLAASRVGQQTVHDEEVVASVDVPVLPSVPNRKRIDFGLSIVFLSLSCSRSSCCASSTRPPTSTSTWPTTWSNRDGPLPKRVPSWMLWIYIYIFFNRVFEANGSSFYRWLFFSIRSRADAAAGSPRHCLGCPTRFLLVPDSVQLVLIGFATSVDLVELSCHLVSLVDLCHRLGGLYLVLPSFEHCLWEFFDFYWYWPRVT